MSGNFILFKSEETGTHYLWNGIYPVKVSPDGEPWHPEAILTEEEESDLEFVNLNNRRIFEVTGRGKFKTVKRGTFEQF